VEYLKEVQAKCGTVQLLNYGDSIDEFNIQHGTHGKHALGQVRIENTTLYQLLSKQIDGDIQINKVGTYDHYQPVSAPIGPFNTLLDCNWVKFDNITTTKSMRDQTTKTP
jgi:hypothetical protein